MSSCKTGKVDDRDYMHRCDFYNSVPLVLVASLTAGP